MSCLYIRVLDQKDLPQRVSWFNHSSIYHQMPIQVPMSLAETEKWFFANLLSETRRDFVADLCSDDGNCELVAMAGLVDIDAIHRRAELYVFVQPGQAGKRIGSSFVRWLCNYGFSSRGLNRIYLYTIQSNHRARHFYERLGFLREGILRAHNFHHGDFVDRYIHGMLRSEWEKQDWRETGPISFEIPLNRIGSG